jgi:hypothetical protein
MNKRILNKVFAFTFQYLDDEDIYTGYVIDFNDNWLLLKLITVDYVADGYVILNTKFIKDYKRGEKQKFIQKILDLKGKKPTDKEKIPLTDLKTIFTFLSEKYGLFQFDQRTQKACWLGKVKKITGNDMKIDYLNPRAIWSTTMPTYKLGNVRTIQFDTDYINSLLLVAKKKK